MKVPRHVRHVYVRQGNVSMIMTDEKMRALGQNANTLCMRDGANVACRKGNTRLICINAA